MSKSALEAFEQCPNRAIAQPIGQEGGPKEFRCPRTVGGISLSGYNLSRKNMISTIKGRDAFADLLGCQGCHYKDQPMRREDELSIGPDGTAYVISRYIEIEENPTI